MVVVREYLFEFSGIHPTLPRAELFSSFKSENIRYELIDEEDRFILIRMDSEDITKLMDGFALTKSINICHATSSDWRELLNITLPIKNKSYCLRVRNFGIKKIDNRKIERILGKHLRDIGRVDLEKPDINILLFSGKKFYLTTQIYSTNSKDFEKRKVALRPFFSPISIHPRFARMMVNLCMVKRGGTILDPFCGTGGILMEASLLGYRVIGTDIDKRMIDGTKKNLAQYSIHNVNLYCTDVSELNRYIDTVDGIVTDPPYGKSASTKKESIVSLYKRGANVLRSLLKDDGYMVIILPDKKYVDLFTNDFSLVSIHSMRVHKSLTRHFCVLKPGTR